MTTVIIPTLDPDSEMCVQAVEAVTATTDAKVLIQHDANRDGFAHTCNLAAKEAAGDLIFLNDDTIVQPGWLEALDTARNAVPSAAIAGSHLLYPDGRTQHSGVFLRRDHMNRLEPYNRRRPAPSGPVPAVTGACLWIARDVWDELGGFDESFVNGYEDIDLCLRARQAGHDVRYVADSVVVHLESQSPGRFDHAQENIALLQERWGDLPI